MGKHKKTRKEKIIADFRHQVYILENKSFPTSNPAITNSLINTNPHSYSYALNDVLKTTILTAFIIIGELVLFFLLKNHIIILPKISY